MYVVFFIIMSYYGLYYMSEHRKNLQNQQWIDRK
jgi:hypothetical protein